MNVFGWQGLAIVLIAITTGCTAVPPNLNATQASRYKKVGVVSLSARTFWRQHVGFTVFGNERETKDITSWALDTEIAQRARGAIDKLGGIQAVDGKYSIEEFLHLYDLNGPWNALIFQGPNWKAISEYTGNYCATNEVDGILITYDIVAEDFIGETNQFVRGIGFYTRGSGDATHIALLHVVAQAGLLDCRTNKPVAIRGLATIKNAGLGTILRAAPMFKVDPPIARKPLSELTTDDEKLLKRAIIELYERTWEPSLSFMFAR